MITFKQIDALYWIAELGSFEAAANKLNMSQSAISKRIQELEDTFDVEIFDRSKRNARLTEKGGELLNYARDLLERRDYLLERVSAREVLVRRFRLGVTELTALTWLPALVEALREAYPKVQIEPSVELSSELFRKLENDQLDLVIVPEIYDDSRFHSTGLDEVENVWICAPHLVPENDPVSLATLANFTVLTQGAQSGTGLTYERWLAANNVQLPRTLTSHNLLVQVGLTLSGVGVSYLPKACLSHLIDAGALRALVTEPQLPKIRYVAMHRKDRQFGLNQQVAQLALQCCDFSRLLF